MFLRDTTRDIFYRTKRAWVPHRCDITQRIIWPGQKAYKKEVYSYSYCYGYYRVSVESEWLSAPGYMFEKLKQGYDIPNVTVNYPD